jgi:energy-coupling factor transporter transmembrane protein EcfT
MKGIDLPLIVCGSVFVACMLFQWWGKKTSTRPKTVTSRDWGKWLLKAKQYAIYTGLVGCIIGGLLILIGYDMKRDVWNDIYGTVAMWALFALIVPIFAIAEMGDKQAVKWFSIVSMFIIFLIVVAEVYEKSSAERAIQQQSGFNR